MSVAEQYKPAGFTAEDIVLFDNARNGDIQAYGNLFERYIDSILFAYQHDSRMEYDDLRQNVYLKTFPNLFKIKDIRAWWSFCHKTARGLLKDAEKKNKPLLYDDNTDAKTNAVSLADSNRYSSPDFNLLNEEIRHELLNEVKTLSEIDQRISFLFFIEEFTIAKISEELNMPWSTVNDHINSIRNKLSKSKKLQSLRQYGLCPVLLQRIFEFGNTGTQTAGSGIFKGIISLFTSVVKWCFSFVGMIFAAMLWLTSCLILGTKGMAEFGKSIQGTSLRALFIKFCSVGYALVVLTPIFVFETDFYLVSSICSEDRLLVQGTDILLVLWGVMLSCFILYARRRFVRIPNSNINPVSATNEIDATKKSLRALVNSVCWLVAIGIVFFCFHCLLGIHEYPRNPITFLFKHNWTDLVTGLVLYLGYHFFSWHAFIILVDNIDHEYSSELCINGRRYGIRLLNAAGMVFTLFIPVLGLIMGSKKVVSLIFISFFILAWLLLIIWNRKRQLIFPIFLLSVTLFVFLQAIAYLLGWR